VVVRRWHDHELFLAALIVLDAFTVGAHYAPCWWDVMDLLERLVSELCPTCRRRLADGELLQDMAHPAALFWSCPCRAEMLIDLVGGPPFGADCPAYRITQYGKGSAT
jgi:hypothetical protein